MTADDRTVQVPVSLIERLELAANVSNIRDSDAAREARALLRQPSVSLPTREQIAARLRGDIFDAVPDDNDMQHVLSLAAALLSQPTPAAAHDEECLAGEWNEAAGVTCVCTCGAEPPRIEDMAPGTTFLSTVDQHNTTALRFMRTSTGGAVDQDGTLWPLNAFDPSTIRDVTSPKDAA